jgi:hypothetical protein
MHNKENTAIISNFSKLKQPLNSYTDCKKALMDANHTSSYVKDGYQKVIKALENLTQDLINKN